MCAGRAWIYNILGICQAMIEGDNIVSEGLGDVDRGVTLHEFKIANERTDKKFDELLKRLDKIDERLKMEQKQRDTDKKKTEDERAMVHKEWAAGNFTKWLQLYFKANQGGGGDLSCTFYHLKGA
jgi:hypothetical protein